MDDRGVERQVPPLPPLVAALLTFVATASVLVLEIGAGRLLAPYVGVSLTTYTGIIGAILAGIALGAWLGGRAADAIGPLPLLGPATPMYEYRTRMSDQPDDQGDNGHAGEKLQ